MPEGVPMKFRFAEVWRVFGGGGGGGGVFGGESYVERAVGWRLLCRCEYRRLQGPGTRLKQNLRHSIPWGLGPAGISSDLLASEPKPWGGDKARPQHRHQRPTQGSAWDWRRLFAAGTPLPGVRTARKLDLVHRKIIPQATSRQDQRSNHSPQAAEGEVP